MIFVTGDVHGGVDMDKLSNKHFPIAKQLTREDYVIICGDFGLPFLDSDVYPDGEFIPNKHARKNRSSYQYWIKWLSERPFTILFADGNHDNHPFWAKQPVMEWNGGLVNPHPDADNIFHLKRGEYYTIGGKTFWVMGGAESHDKDYRIDGYTWWQEEIPSCFEMSHGFDTLEEHGYQVDYIITHTMPQNLIRAALGIYYPPEPTCQYLDEVYLRTTFTKWYCGHFHEDIDKEYPPVRVIFNDVERIV